MTLLADKEVAVFIGRESEIASLENLFSSKGGKLSVFYGRRRIGKSFLIEEFCKSKDCLRFEGLEGEHTKVQIQQFARDLGKQIGDPLLSKARIDHWNDIFDRLTLVLEQRRRTRTVVFIDEFQWLAAQHSVLVSLFKKYWDQHWSKCNVLFILCGSISSYMVKKVIKSKALYGRIHLEQRIDSLPLHDIKRLLTKNRSPEEAFNYYLAFGGVPKYWEEIVANQSFEQNINRLFFSNQGFLFNDYERIFYSQFKEHKTYEHIIRLLELGPLAMEDIGRKMKMSSGGTLKFYLDNLELAGFIQSYVPFDKTGATKLKRYKLIDEYLRFFLKFVEPNKKMISQQKSSQLLFRRLVKSKWEIWAGFAFENFCQKNALVLAQRMGFADYVESYGPLFFKGQKGFQVDLLFQRTDKVITLCEMKYHQKPVSALVIPEVKKKCALLKVPRGFTIEKALFTIHGAEASVRQSEYFDHILELKDYV
jgi:AAA+ ATPase superfamily predicted ATPase